METRNNDPLSGQEEQLNNQSTNLKKVQLPTNGSESNTQAMPDDKQESYIPAQGSISRIDFNETFSADTQTEPSLEYANHTISDNEYQAEDIDDSVYSEDTYLDDYPDNSEFIDDGGMLDAQEKHASNKAIIIGVGLVILVAVAALIGGSLIGTSLAQQQNSQQAKNIEAPSIDHSQDSAFDSQSIPYEYEPVPSEAENINQETCEHQWTPKLQTREVEATYKTEDVPEVTETYTAYHTICNVCHEVIDGNVSEHKAQTGHSGYTTDVPRQETRVVTPATTRQVVDVPAHEETFWNQEICSECGAVQDVDEQVVQSNTEQAS